MNIQNRNPIGANALSGPKTPGGRIDRSRVDPQIREAAEGMEAMFLDYMLKTMRETVPENAMGLDSPATKIYTGMMDSEIAERTARGGGIGLAEPIIAYLLSKSYTSGRGHGVPGNAGDPGPVKTSTGGTDESRPNRKQ